MKTIEGLKYRLSANSARSQNVLKNVLLSFVVKGGNILVGFILVPLTLNYISPVEYGIWLTISSIVGWMYFFDIGMGNGLRNKLAEVYALGNYDEGRRYVSSTYMMLAGISVVLIILLAVLVPLIDWKVFLNVPNSVSINISIALLIVCLTFCVQFIVQLINTVLMAVHEPAKAGFISFVGQLSVLVVVYFLTRTTKGNFILLVSVLTVVPVIVMLLFSIYLYKSKLRFISPSLKYVNSSYARKVLSGGGSFLVIQVGALVLFQTSNIIISKFVGPLSVTEFNIAYKLFSVLIMAFTIVMTPYWSAFTDAYVKKDVKWMGHQVKTTRFIWLFISFIVTPILLFVAPSLLKIWIGDSVQISKKMMIAMAFYTVGYIGMSLNSYILNGIGKIKIQKYLYIIVCVVNIPFSIMMAKRIGGVGVVFSNTILIVIMFVIMWKQIDMILKGGAVGIWNQ